MEWISVNDRLPEYGNWALWSDGKVVDCGCYGVDNDWDEEDATHWMPLPDPPKLKNSNDIINDYSISASRGRWKWWM